MEERGQRGDGNAAFNACIMRARGVGCEPDEKAALTWLQQAADLGVAKAQSQLAFMYEKGRVVTQSDAMAAKWYASAAFQDDPESLYKMASLYESGVGVEKDDDAAIRCWTRAAELGHAKAPGRLRIALDERPPPPPPPKKPFWRLLCCCWPSRTKIGLEKSNPLAEPLIERTDDEPRRNSSGDMGEADYSPSGDDHHELVSEHSPKHYDDDDSLNPCKDS